MHLQEIGTPPRIHLDLESKDRAATVERARDLGGELVRVGDSWSTLCSRGGRPFCVVGLGSNEPPEPTTWPDGHRSRLVQVCIDSPRSAHDREVAFWRALLDGRWAASTSPEFAGKWHDDAGSPVQLLFQRLDEEEGNVRAHVDHGTDDLEAEVRRVLALGADDVGPGHGGWHALRDPAGLPFYFTENSPEQVAHRDIG